MLLTYFKYYQLLTTYFLFINSKFLQCVMDNKNDSYEGNFLASPTCRENAKASSYKSGKHKGDHDMIPYQILSELVSPYIKKINIQQYAQLNRFYKEVSKLLQTLTANLKNLQKALMENIKKSLLEKQMMLKSKQEGNKYWAFSLNRTEQMNQMRCCDIYDMWDKLFNKGTQKAKLKIENSQLMQIICNGANFINEQFQKSIKQFTNQIGKYRKAKPAERKAQQKVEKSDSQSQCGYKQCEEQRPERHPRMKQEKSNKQQHRQHLNRREKVEEQRRDDRKIDKAARQNLGKELKIQNLENLKEGDKFNIRLKVHKIIKRFNIKEKTMIQFVGGDKTGVAICVMAARTMIQTGKTVLVTDCKIYEFKKKIKQIQSTPQSSYSQTEDIPYINFHYDFTRNSKEVFKGESYDKHEKESQNGKQIAKTIKIASIQPGSSDLTITAQIYKIQSSTDELIQCTLGDETGIVRAQLPEKLNFIQEGRSIKLTLVSSQVENEHIVIKLQKYSKVQALNMTFPIINFSNNISAFAWVSQSQSDGEGNG